MTDSMSKAPRQRLQWSAAEKSEWLTLFRESGQSAAEFARVSGIAYATLSLWLRQSEGAEADDEEGEIVEVPRELVAQLANSSASSATAHLRLPGGARLEIAPGTDPAWLAQLAHAFAQVER